MASMSDRLLLSAASVKTRTTRRPPSARDGCATRFHGVPQGCSGGERGIVSKMTDQRVVIAGQGRIQRDDVAERAETRAVRRQQALHELSHRGVQPLGDVQDARAAIEQDGDGHRLNIAVEDRNGLTASVVFNLEVLGVEIGDESSAAVGYRGVDRHGVDARSEWLAGLEGWDARGHKSQTQHKGRYDALYQSHLPR